MPDIRELFEQGIIDESTYNSYLKKYSENAKKKIVEPNKMKKEKKFDKKLDKKRRVIRNPDYDKDDFVIREIPDEPQPKPVIEPKKVPEEPQPKPVIEPKKVEVLKEVEPKPKPKKAKKIPIDTKRTSTGKLIKKARKMKNGKRVIKNKRKAKIVRRERNIYTGRLNNITGKTFKNMLARLKGEISQMQSKISTDKTKVSKQKEEVGELEYLDKINETVQQSKEKSNKIIKDFVLKHGDYQQMTIILFKTKQPDEETKGKKVIRVHDTIYVQRDIRQYQVRGMFNNFLEKMITHKYHREEWKSVIKQLKFNKEFKAIFETSEESTPFSGIYLMKPIKLAKPTQSMKSMKELKKKLTKSLFKLKLFNELENSRMMSKYIKYKKIHKLKSLVIYLALSSANMSKKTIKPIHVLLISLLTHSISHLTKLIQQDVDIISN